MKISTITCHDVYNHGASLQAYALMTYLNNQGHNVEIIDYKPYYMGNLYKLSNIGSSISKKLSTFTPVSHCASLLLNMASESFNV